MVILKWSDRLLRSSEKKNKQKVLGGRSRKPEIIFWPKTLIFYQKDVLFLIGAASSKPLWVPYCPSLLCFFPGRYIHYSLREQQPRMFHAKSSCCKLPSPFLSCFHTWQTIRFMVLPHSTSVFWG